jgi:hypothetical protein
MAGGKAGKDSGKSKQKAVSRSARAGLQFPVGRSVSVLHALVPVLHTLVPVLHTLVPVLHRLVPVVHTLVPVLLTLVPILHTGLVPVLYT